MLPIKNVAFYSFFSPGFDVQKARLSLLEQMQTLAVRGTILLSQEGVNASLSGESEAVDQFLTHAWTILGIVPDNLKVSLSRQVSFKRSVVKIKPHIVAAPGATPIDPQKDKAPYLSPEEFHGWITSGKEMIVLDTRNDYEFQQGCFKNSKHLGTRHFADFEKDLEKAPAAWHDQPIVTFCTGGIRCEKAAPLMLKKGFKNVYQLEGGILKYFETVGRGYFEGDCFVFDERVALNERLHPSQPANIYPNDKDHRTGGGYTL